MTITDTEIINHLYDTWNLQRIPISAIIKGLFMMIVISTFSETSNNTIFILSLLMLCVHRKQKLLFYIFFGLFWPLMEVVILHYSKGHAWNYAHPDWQKIPIYLFPLWAIVSECVVDITEKAYINNLI